MLCRSRVHSASGVMEEAVAKGEAKSCLMLAPLTLHYYPGRIRDELAAMGYAVTLANDEYPANPLGKLLGKFDLPLSRWLTRLTIRRRHLSGSRWDLVVILKGRGVGPELVKDLKASGARVVGYHYDALGYDRSTLRWSSVVDRVSTFDYRDAARQGWPLIPLFSAETGASRPPEARYAVSAVLRNHSQRLAFVDRVVRAIGRERAFIYFYEKDALSFLDNLMRQPLLYWRWRRHIHFRPLDFETYREVLAGSEFTIDYAHPAQTGATMRSVEAAAAGIKTITNNPNLLDQPQFDQAGLIVVDPCMSVAELRRRVTALIGYRPAARPRSPQLFLREVLGDVADDPPSSPADELNQFDAVAVGQ